MSNSQPSHICPVEKAGGLDTKFRKLVQNPRSFLKPYLRKGMVAIDLGCGPGFFTPEMAKLTGDEGKIYAVDFQQGMLDKLAAKIYGTQLQQRIVIHRCEEDKLNLEEQVDFIHAFYVIHEIPDKERLFRELKTILKPGGKMLIVEPLFHVNKQKFDSMLKIIKDTGFKVLIKKKLISGRLTVITCE